MRINLLVLASAALLLASCQSHPAGEFRIHGTVPDPELEGACIFLVPMLEPVIEPTKENLDSTFIKDGKFEFKGTVERLSDIRIEKLRRIGTQNLLVVTEPGDITVVIGAASSGGGTPQNDSLQVWKTLTQTQNAETMAASRAGLRSRADSIHSAYKARTQEMAAALQGTTLGDWLSSLYPVKTEE